VIATLRNAIGLAVAGAIVSLVSAGTAATPVNSSAKPVAIKVYKTPQCGCCKAWVKHLRDNGFQVETMDMPDLTLVKQKYGVKPALEACHTAVVNGYVVEGHVPADVIVKFLRERPAVTGIAVPGMPMGSPGMEGGSKQSYNVLTFDRAGHTRVYAHR
jgi:hypothetical protein